MHPIGSDLFIDLFKKWAEENLIEHGTYMYDIARNAFVSGYTDGFNNGFELGDSSRLAKVKSALDIKE